MDKMKVDLSAPEIECSIDGIAEEIDSGTSAIADSIYRLAQAVAIDAAPGTDASGGSVSCLTEALMGVTAGLHAIADAIRGLSR